MLNEINSLLTLVQGQRVANRNEPALLQAEATLLLAKEVQQLNRSMQNVTAASDVIPGGYALKVVSADR